MDKSSRLTNDLLITQYLPRSTYRRLRVQILLKTRWVSVFSYQKGKERKSLEPTETISPQGPGYKQNKRKYTQAEVYLEYSTMQQFGISGNMNIFKVCVICLLWWRSSWVCALQKIASNDLKQQDQEVCLELNHQLSSTGGLQGSTLSCSRGIDWIKCEMNHMSIWPIILADTKHNYAWWNQLQFKICSI